MNEKEFVNGLIIKAPHENAPEFVKCKISMKREELIEWLQNRDGDWVNLDVKVSQQGKWYAEVDDWRPNQSGSQPQSDSQSQASQPDDDFDDDIPF
ncbi:MAG: hypothetical protein KAT69_07865 [Candidatus Aminicenantes bacterium]|nr:hypothetical protein [Candidatus Aminicenantes bacterium]